VEYEKIWKYAKIVRNRQTISGLYPIFIPAKYCLEEFDIYGFTIVEEMRVMTDEGLH
jgi:hypothetical protein